MSTAAEEVFEPRPSFCEGILYEGASPLGFDRLGRMPVIGEGERAIKSTDEAVVFQTRLVADALRYTTLQLCASKE